ncbi:MAG TPA: acyl-CoA desaturase [Methylomirabilota bacterium]|nr:acyl-CoA desaturase [Methylomirabilota bacterium]
MTVPAPRAAGIRGGVMITVLHLIPLMAVSRATARDWLACAALYLAFVVGGGMGLHRYFAHRAFRTSRAFQLVLALLGSTAFGEPIGFAGKHRLHHRYSDTAHDVHAPREGFWPCWFGSLFERPARAADIARMTPDLRRYPELVWLHRWWYVPTLALGALTWWAGGFTMFAIGFVLSRVIILHAVSAVNYFCHRNGHRRFATRDHSTNNVLVALLTFGEGWHNNHHRYPRAARAGLRWWELDPIYYGIRFCAALGLVWDVREAPSAPPARGSACYHPRRAGRSVSRPHSITPSPP